MRDLSRIMATFTGCLIVLIVTISFTSRRTHTVTRTVTNMPTVRIVGSPNDIPIGAMTAQEYNSLRLGQSADYLDNNFGAWPNGNVENDHRTFYPAAEGGRYIFYFNKKQRIVRKEYVQ